MREQPGARTKLQQDRAAHLDQAVETGRPVDRLGDLPREDFYGFRLAVDRRAAGAGHDRGRRRPPMGGFERGAKFFHGRTHQRRMGSNGDHGAA